MQISITADCRELNKAIETALLKLEALNSLDGIPQPVLGKINNLLACFSVKSEICEIGSFAANGAGELVVAVGPGIALKEFITALGAFSTDVEFNCV
jgi:hypothetical protein